MIGHAPWADPNNELSFGDFEKAFYVCMAQADFAAEALNANMTVEQLVASREAEAKAKADASASETAKATAGDVATPAAPKQPVDDPVVPAKDVEAPAGGVKRPSDGVPAPSSKRARRRKPEFLGTRDG